MISKFGGYEVAAQRPSAHKQFPIIISHSVVHRRVTHFLRRLPSSQV